MTCDLNCINGILDIFESGAIVIGAGAAIYGLNTWRREMVGRKKADLAEEVLAGFYEFEDLMNWVRSPFSTSNEGEGRKVDPGETDGETRRKNSYFVPIERLQTQSDFLSHLRSLRYRFMAYFGKDAVKPFDILHDVKTSVLVSAEMLIMPGENEKEDKRKWKASIHWNLSDEDEIISKIQEAIKQVEDICGPYLMDKGAK